MDTASIPSFPSSSFSYAIAIDFAQFLSSRAAFASVSVTEPQQQQQQHRHHVAAALLEWWISYQSTSLIRKTSAVVQIIGTKSNDSVLVLQVLVAKDNDADDEERTATTTKIEDTIRASVKKIEVEDLGAMNAAELVVSMRITTTVSCKDNNSHHHHHSSTNGNSTPKKQQQPQPQQPGIHDLHTLEQQLRVKVVFNTTNGHVYLVGDAKKLAKKVYPIRNILRHYHWRLSGQES